MDASGKILVGIFLGLLAVAFTGDTSPGVGFSKECIDGIDNDADGSIDQNDSDCSSYPYADGAGEAFTQIGADYQSEKYEYSYFDWQRLYGGITDASHCNPVNFESYETSYGDIQNYSNGKDTAYDDYVYWRAQNCP
jgi:hypothetical protein